MTRLVDLTPAAEQGWWTLFDLAADQGTDDWMVIGGQMMQVLAAENGIDKVRPTEDVDVVVDVRSKPGGTEALSSWLKGRGFALAGISTDGIGHRFTRGVDGGPGTVIFDVLAPEGLGAKANTFTVKPARTVQVPGAVQAFGRSEVVEVTVSGMAGKTSRTGAVRRPNLLGALVAKAAATGIVGRENPERDWQDAALLLATVADPVAAAQECERKDRQRLRLLRPLADREHVGWANLDDEAFRRGTTTLDFVSGD